MSWWTILGMTINNYSECEKLNKWNAQIQKATIKMLQRKERLSHAEVTVRTKSEKNEMKFIESLSNEVQNKTCETWHAGFKVHWERGAKASWKQKNFGPKKTMQENISLLI